VVTFGGVDAAVTLGSVEAEVAVVATAALGVLFAVETADDLVVLLRMAGREWGSAKR
jgi:hypothetical protein